MSRYVRPTITLDPRFPVPLGAIDVENSPLVVEESDAFDEIEGGLPVPQAVVVVSQSQRYAADGSLVVDLVLDIDDIEGIVKYDIRESKV